MGIALSDVVQATVTASSASPTQPGFGVPLIMAQKVPVAFANRVRSYTNLSSMVSDGFATTDDAYLAAQAAFSANPAAPLIKVGRRANKTVQIVKLKCLSATQGDIYTITLVTPAGVATTITRTVPGASTTTAEATAIAALIAAVSGFAGTTSATDTITIASPTTGTLNGYKDWTSTFYLTDESADPGIAADMAAVIAEDNNWYGLDIDSHSKAEIVALAAWAEANKKLFVTNTCDATAADSVVSTDVMSTLQASSYHYTGLLYNQNNTKCFAGFEWQSLRFAGTPTPGGDTWMYNTLPGIKVDNLTETQFQTLGNKSGTGYVNIQGGNVTAAGGISISKSGGWSASGEFLDVRRYLDWLISQVQLGLYTVLIAQATTGKVPFTDKGISRLQGVVLGALQRGEQSGGGVEGSSVVTAPAAANVSSADKAARILRNLNWSQSLQGAVHLVVSSGTVSV